MKTKNILLSFAILLTSFLATSQEIKEIKVEGFNSIKLEGSAQWVIIPSDTEKVVIESKTQDVFNYIDVETIGDRLIISTTEKTKNITKLFNSVTIKVYAKNIDAISLSGVGSVRMEGGIESDEFNATLRGTGDMKLKVTCESFDGYVYGTGNLEVSGSSKTTVVRVEGVGGFEGYGFESIDCDVTVSGVGGAEVFATSKLTAVINGVGSIRYKGDPVKKDLQSNGLGSIKEAR